MKKCPKCGKLYRDYDQYCVICRYKLKYIEGSKIWTMLQNHLVSL